jgi:hypothetical protein
MKRFRRGLWIAVFLALLLIAASLGMQRTPVQNRNALALLVPGPAVAQDGPFGMLNEEAGIGAYLSTTTTPDLSGVGAAFRTIEDKNDQYIIGSVAVENYPESHDVHVLVTSDGWIVAYYLSSDPAAKIVDLIELRTTPDTLNTKLESALATVAGAAGIPYSTPAFYDFRYPAATHLVLVADGGAGDSFEVQLPSSFTYYEVSWSLYSWAGGSYWKLDETLLGSAGPLNEGVIPRTQLLPDAPHTVQVDDYGALAVVYKKEE